MSNSLTIMLVIISLAAFVMLCINLYVVLRPKRKEDDTQLSVLHQRLDSFSQLVNEQLERNRQASEQSVVTVSKILSDELEKHRLTTDRATSAVNQQVQGFTQNLTKLHENVKLVQESVKNVSSFQDIFKSPKLRGQWGEASLEAALAQYFSKDMYGIQHYFSSGEAVDAILKLPNNLLLPIDSKFNWENFEKMINSETEINRDLYRKTFFSDVKKKIDEISSKYILPSEGTTDLALMYVPAETVYYEIINNIKDVDIPHYARSKKVFLVSPNTFALSVSAIRHWFRDVQINQQTKDIMKRLDRIVTDGGKLADDFRKLGNHISNAKSSYDESEKRLSLMVDRVKNVVEIGQKEDVVKIESPSQTPTA